MTTAVTKESLAARIAEHESGARSLKEDYTLAAYKMLLATMEADPVAWTDEQELRDVDRGGCGYIFTVNPVTPHADERRIILLYRHAQQPGGEPVAIPGKWIPVSERVPEEGGRYWCYVEEQNSLGKSHYHWNCSWNGDVWSDKALTGRVTHWMPLPAGPVK